MASVLGETNLNVQTEYEKIAKLEKEIELISERTQKRSQQFAQELNDTELIFKRIKDLEIEREALKARYGDVKDEEVLRPAAPFVSGGGDPRKRGGIGGNRRLVAGTFVASTSSRSGLGGMLEEGGPRRASGAEQEEEKR